MDLNPFPLSGPPLPAFPRGEPAALHTKVEQGGVGRGGVCGRDAARLNLVCFPSTLMKKRGVDYSCYRQLRPPLPAGLEETSTSSPRPRPVPMGQIKTLQMLSYPLGGKPFARRNFTLLSAPSKTQSRTLQQTPMIRHEAAAIPTLFPSSPPPDFAQSRGKRQSSPPPPFFQLHHC